MVYQEIGVDRTPHRPRYRPPQQDLTLPRACHELSSDCNGTDLNRREYARPTVPARVPGAGNLRVREITHHVVLVVVKHLLSRGDGAVDRRQP
jgi:hypothetical protein